MAGLCIKALPKAEHGGASAESLAMAAKATSSSPSALRTGSTSCITRKLAQAEGLRMMPGAGVHLLSIAKDSPKNARMSLSTRGSLLQGSLLEAPVATRLPNMPSISMLVMRGTQGERDEVTRAVTGREKGQARGLTNRVNSIRVHCSHSCTFLTCRAPSGQPGDAAINAVSLRHKSAERASS